MSNALNLPEVYAGILDRAIESGANLAVDMFIPNRCYILVRRLPEIRETKAGIQLPGNAIWRRNSGVVVRTPVTWGPDGKPVPDPSCPFMEGDLVFFDENAGRQIILNGEAYEIMHYEGDFGGDIFGHVPKETLDALEAETVGSGSTTQSG